MLSWTPQESCASVKQPSHNQNCAILAHTLYQETKKLTFIFLKERNHTSATFVDVPSARSAIWNHIRKHTQKSKHSSATFATRPSDAASPSNNTNSFTSAKARQLPLHHQQSPQSTHTNIHTSKQLIKSEAAADLNQPKPAVAHHHPQLLSSWRRKLKRRTSPKTQT